MCAYGTDEFPAFFTRRSGCTAPARADDPDAAARMISVALQLDLGSGIVIGPPVVQSLLMATLKIKEHHIDTPP